MTELCFCDKEKTKKPHGACAPSDLKINLLCNPYGVDKNNISFSWIMNDSNKDEYQTAYRLVISDSINAVNQRKFLYDSGWRTSSENTGITEPGIENYLQENHIYYWAVATKNKEDIQSPLSDFTAFATTVKWEKTEGIWSGGESKNSDFAFLRSEYEITQKEILDTAHAILSVTAASPEMARQFVYCMYVNGSCVGIGPARYGKDINGDTLLYYQSYDVTKYLKAGKNCLASVNYALSDHAFLCQLTLHKKDGSHVVLANSARDSGKWRALSADSIFGKENSIGTNYFTAHANNINAEQYPFGYNLPGFDDTLWGKAYKSAHLDEYKILTYAEEENIGRYEAGKDEYDIKTERLCSGDYVVDMGAEIIGSFRLDIPYTKPCKIDIYYGEELNGDGTVKYKMLTSNNYRETWTLKEGMQSVENISLMTYRYVQISGAPFEITPDMVCAVEIRAGFNKNESYFSSDNSILNGIYKLMKHTVKVTTQDLYVDSQSRERGAYEGDVLINLLASYAFKNDYSIGRFSIEYLYTHRTWPAEYLLVIITAAKADYLTTGDASSLSKYYEILKHKPFTENFDKEIGLISNPSYASSGNNALLADWPPSERDGYDMNVKYSTILNALSARAYREFAFIADVLNCYEDANVFEKLADTISDAMIKKLYIPEKRTFCDGISQSGEMSSHCSQHAAAYALYAGIYKDREMSSDIAGFIKEQGRIKMSVYGAFFLLDGLYSSGNGSIANQFMLSNDITDKRTWAYMINVLKATVTTEAWCPENKGNMTFSHPWGAAPAHMIISGIFGIKATSAGYKTFDIKFCTDGIGKASVKMPTVKGTIHASFDNTEGICRYSVTVPANAEATLYLPAEENCKLFIDGRQNHANYNDGFIVITVGSGLRNITVE